MPLILLFSKIPCSAESDAGLPWHSSGSVPLTSPNNNDASLRNMWVASHHWINSCRNPEESRPSLVIRVCGTCTKTDHRKSQLGFPMLCSWLYSVQNTQLICARLEAAIRWRRRRLQPIAAAAPSRGNGPGTGATTRLIWPASPLIPFTCQVPIKPGVVKPRLARVLLLNVAVELIEPALAGSIAKVELVGFEFKTVDTPVTLEPGKKLVTKGMPAGPVKVKPGKKTPEGGTGPVQRVFSLTRPVDVHLKETEDAGSWSDPLASSTTLKPDSKRV